MQLTRTRALAFAPVLLILPALASSCGDPKINLATATPAERFQWAMKDFEREDYKGAIEKFNTVILQDPTSEFADDAQFYLGESHFRDGEYLLAAFQFNRLRSNFPNSPFYRQALLRTAEAYAQTSPNFERDQTDTRTAIGQYEAFLRLYPEDSLATVARQEILRLRTKLARKEFSIAEQYAGMDEHRAALIYYERVIELYPDTEYSEKATIGKIQVLQSLDRGQEARDAINQFMQEHPSSSATPQMRQMLNELQR